MTEPTPPQPPRGTGRAFAVYTAWRLLLFVVAYLLLVTLGVPGLLGLAGAVLLSAVVSIFVLRQQREALARAANERARYKRAQKDSIRARLDDAARSDRGRPEGPRPDDV